MQEQLYLRVCLIMCFQSDLPRLDTLILYSAALKMYESPKSLVMKSNLLNLVYLSDLPSLRYLKAYQTGDYYAPFQFVSSATIISMNL